MLQIKIFSGVWATLPTPYILNHGVVNGTGTPRPRLWIKNKGDKEKMYGKIVNVARFEIFKEKLHISKIPWVIFIFLIIFSQMFGKLSKILMFRPIENFYPAPHPPKNWPQTFDGPRNKKILC